MTFILAIDLGILNVNMHAKNEDAEPRLSELTVLTDKRKTYASENISSLTMMISIDNQFF